MSIDCLAGTHTTVALVAPEQDLNYLNSRSVTFDRQQTQLRDTSIPMFGDSITEGMDVSQLSPNVVNMGINGSTMRDFFGRANRSLINGNPIARHCQGCIFALGVNDTQYEYATGVPQDPPYIYDLLKLWITGKWVIVKILPVNETMYQAGGGSTFLTNANIDAVNAHTQSIFSGVSGIALVDAKSTLAPAGQLLPAYTLDGLHLSGAGYAALYPLIISAMTSLGLS